MLDQNTDRMWFVIGAVIVGAAIIFIANGTLPTLFASVSDSFGESADKGMEVITEMSTRDTVYERSRYTYSGAGIRYGWTIGDQEGSVVAKNIKVKPNTWYRVTYDKVGHGPDMAILTQSDTSVKSIHNALYTDPARLRQLKTTKDFRNYRVTEDDGTSYTLVEYLYQNGPVTYEFSTSAEEEYLSLTSGNVSAAGRFVPFTFHFDNIKIVEMF